MGSLKVYRKGTRKLIENMKKGNLKIDRKGGRVHVSGDEYNCTLSTKGSLARDVLLPAKRETDKSGDLARKIGCSENGLYKILNDNYPHGATKEEILCALLNWPEIPTLEEINSVLTRMRRPLLYTGTISRSENCRDYLMICIFQCARDRERPPKGWVEFANQAILYFNQRVGTAEKIMFQMMPLLKNPAGGKSESFIQQARERQIPLDEWAGEMARIAQQETPQYRKKMMEEYCRRQGILSVTQASVQLSEQVHLADDHIRRIFGKRGKPGCRESLIDCGIAMGCSYEEVNHMLREAVAPILYPNSSASDDVIIMERLLKNEELRNKNNG